MNYKTNLLKTFFVIVSCRNLVFIDKNPVAATTILTKIKVIYRKSGPETQRKIIGWVYPEKFTFDELK